jgi:peroxin-1
MASRGSQVGALLLSFFSLSYFICFPPVLDVCLFILKSFIHLEIKNPSPTGVCVVAATSRPDLVDPALLRPGRLDRLIYCGFPSAPERRAVLVSLARRLPLAGDADLAAVADAAEGFSGADLGSVLADAQLAAAHEALAGLEDQSAGGIGSNSGSAAAAGPPAIAARHLVSAAASASPSIPEAERKRMVAAFERFRGGVDSGTGAGRAEEVLGKKVSWA